MSKNNDAKQPIPDPRHAEAQLYQRIEAARKQIAAAVNKTMMDTGLPTAIMLEILRGIVAETTLMLERVGRVEVEQKAAAEEVEKAGAKGGNEK